MSDFSPALAIEQALKIREAKSALEKAHKADLLKLDNMIEALEAFLLKTMLERGEKQIKTDNGTAYQAPQLRASVESREKLIEHIKATGDFSLMTNAVSKEEVRKYIDEHDAPPPGVAIQQFIQCNIRKA